MSLVDFYEMLKSVGVPVYHHEAELEDCPYIVYSEVDRKYYIADNKVKEKRFVVEVHFFTTTEFDPVFEALENLFSENYIPFDLVKIDYGSLPAQSGVTYYLFKCEV